MKKLIIMGAGGNSKVIIDIINARVSLLGEKIEIVGVLDDDQTKKELIGYPVIGPIETSLRYKEDKDIYFINGIGSNDIRKQITLEFKLQYDTIIHPSAIIGHGVKIDSGTIIMPGVIINTDTIIGKGTIINTGAIIEHDNRIGDFAHMASGVTTAGNVRVGDSTMLGTGSKVIQGISIGKNSIVGAGSVVIRNIPDNCTVVGNPAKIIKYREEEFK